MTHRHSSLRLDPGVGGTAARDGGFGLVELMVSMLIGLVIIAALVTLFVNTSGNNRELARANTMIENGRFAIKVLEENLVHAGYWGGFLPMFDDQTALPVPTDAPTALPNPCLAYSSANWNAAYKTNLIGIPLQVYDAPTAADLAACVTAGIIVVADYQAGTDLLVVRHADTCAAAGAVVGYCDAINANQLYMQAGFCGTEATPYVLDTSGFTLHKRDCGGTLAATGASSFPTSTGSATSR